MCKVRITGWRPGLNKVAMSKAIREHSKHDFATAKICIESVLEGDEVVVWVTDEATARILAAKLVECGALAMVVESPRS